MNVYIPPDLIGIALMIGGIKLFISGDGPHIGILYGAALFLIGIATILIW